MNERATVATAALVMASLVVTTGACAHGTTASPPPVPAVSYGRSGPSGLSGPEPGPRTCHYRKAADGYVLPDPACTPGAVDPDVSESDIESTICARGWTSSVRPPEQLTEQAKYESMSAYGVVGPASRYEFDHLVPLELGGSNDGVNLWPEPDEGSPSQFDSSDAYGQDAKDGVEDRLNAEVCSRRVALQAAQRAISANWTTAESVLGVEP